MIALNIYRRHLGPDARRPYIVELRARGMSTREIAEKAGVSEPTVRRDIAESRESAGADSRGPELPSHTVNKVHVVTLLTMYTKLNAHPEHQHRPPSAVSARKPKPATSRSPSCAPRSSQVASRHTLPWSRLGSAPAPSPCPSAVGGSDR